MAVIGLVEEEAAAQSQTAVRLSQPVPDLPPQSFRQVELLDVAYWTLSEI